MSQAFRRLRAASAGLLAVAWVAMAGVAVAEVPPAEVPPAEVPPAEVPPAEVPLAMRSIDPPAPPGSTSLTVAAEAATTAAKGHQVLITWLEPEPAGRLRFARLSGQVWSQPITVAEQVSTPAPADRPSLTVIDTQGVRRTLIARTGDVVARSGDGGRTWGRLPSPMLPFASFAGGDEGAYGFWLAVLEDGSAKLLGTRVLAGETLLDPQVSTGAGTSAAMTWDGPVVVYRDRHDDGGRHIALVRRQDAAWTSPQAIHAETWQPAGKPEVGPRVAASGRRVAVAWYTETAGMPRVLVAFSDDAGRTFAEPIEVAAKMGESAPLGAVDVALDDTHALVLWLAANGSTASLNLARVAANGMPGEALAVASGPVGHFAGIPQLARAGTDVAVTWIEGAPGRVRAVAIPLAALPAAAARPVGPLGTTGTVKAYTGRGRVGDAVPELELVSLDGVPVSLPVLRGRVVLLNLWATWCVPCIAEMPELATLDARHGPAGLAVVAVSVDDAGAQDTVRAFVADRKVPLTVWLDLEMELYRALRVRGLPATFLLDRQGRIVLRRDQAIEAGDAELDQAIREALREPL